MKKQPKFSLSLEKKEITVLTQDEMKKVSGKNKTAVRSTERTTPNCSH